MGLLNKLRADTHDDPPKASKEGKTREVRMTVFPADGGRPYIADVEVDGEGHFELESVHGTFKVTRGSIWQEGNTLRGIVNEQNERTINADVLTGEEVMDPVVYHGAVANNLWMQLDEIVRRKNAWKNSTTWLMTGLAICALLLILWQVKTMGDGFDQLQQAIEALRMSAGDGSGHQNIAPGGR